MDGPQTDLQGADPRLGFDTLITMDLQKKDRTFLGTLPENWYPRPSEKCLEPSGKLCRLLWSSCVSSPISFMVLHTGDTSPSCFLDCSCWLSARHPYPMLCLWKSYLASKIQIKCQCSCLCIHNLSLPASSCCTLGLWLNPGGHVMLPRILLAVYTSLSHGLWLPRGWGWSNS